ncbi:MAG: SUMF1/EgtB/PvdO family nonheme iron enzyme [Kiritimatiellae bacterium]|nr:SUMF1/EgtB/PvdO family nonheme iron enzyme [Kiritimatiellia bacterium]
MKLGFGLICGIFGAVLCAGAVERAELSPELQAMLPPETHVTVQPKNGPRIMGEILSQDNETLVLQVEQRGIRRERSFSMSEVTIETPDYGEILAVRLLDFQLDPRRSLPLKEAEAAQAKLDEYLKHFPDHARAQAVRKLRDAVAEEAAMLARGMEKIDGRWFGPVQAAILKFDRADEIIAGLRAKYVNIEREDFREQPAAKRQHDQLVQFLRETARALPGTVTARLPKLLQDGQFDECAEETSAFAKFWLHRVLRAEAGATQGSEMNALRGMDFKAIVRLQKRILDEWKGATTAPAAPASVPEGMVFVPGGYFMMGDESAEVAQDNFPSHLVWVDSFLMDRAEVTNAEYRKFIEHVQATADSSMEHPDAPPLKDHTPRGWKHPELSGDDQPVMGVDWFDAHAYAQWSGKRLPTEAEWELAARDASGSIYPWGEVAPAERYASNPSGRGRVATDVDLARPPPPPPPPPSGLGIFGGKSAEPPPPPPPTVIAPVPWPARSELPVEAAGVTLDVEARHARSPFGILHMAGNAAEWVADLYDAQYYRKSPVRNPTGPTEGRDRVFRGGSYLDEDAHLRAAYRGNSGANDHLRSGLSTTQAPMIGFRCAKSLPPPAGE